VKRQKSDTAGAEAMKDEAQQASGVVSELGMCWWASARNASTLCGAI